MNINQRTIDALYTVVRESFQMNRFCDRLVSVLGVKFACNNSAGKIHKGVAHYFPQFSDLVGERCLERYNITVEYGATDEGKQNYDSVTEIIQALEDRVVTFQNIVIGTAKISFENDDLQVYADLMDLLRDYNKIVEQVILLNDKIGYYGEDNTMNFDHDIETFWVL